MPKSVNKVILVGNLGKDPEIRYTASGKPIAKFSLATNERFKDRNDEWQERTEWHNVVAWQRLAEIVGEYVTSARRFMSRANCKPQVGRISRAASGSTGPRSLRETSCCWDSVRTGTVISRPYHAT